MLIGDCQIKLSAPMIERFRKEIDWAAPDYQIKVTNLFKEMLVEYIKDYRTRGEAALDRVQRQKRPHQPRYRAT